MIGVSLPLEWLLEGEGEQALSALLAEGVRVVELSSVEPHHDALDLLRAARLLWDRGFLISIGSTVRTAENAVAELFCPLGALLSELRQPSLCITVHPLSGDDLRWLGAVADHVEANRLPVTVALEGERSLPDPTEDDGAAYVLKTVEELDRESIGICRNIENDLQGGQILDKRVLHTHIPSHLLLGSAAGGLKELLAASACGYFGVYCLVPTGRPTTSALVESVRSLRAIMPICADLYDDIRDNFDARLDSALRAIGTGGAKFALIQSASYLFRYSGYRVGMDISFRNAWHLAKDPAGCVEQLKGLDLMLISHSHADHFEKRLVQRLADSGIKWVIPDFMYDLALSCGILPENIYVAKKDEPICIGKMTVLPFEGRHFRPGTRKGVDEYGYYVTAQGMPSLALPVDVRDFSFAGLPRIPSADYCFANVWLGDGRGLDLSRTPLTRDYARFMLRFSSQSILLTHLYESGRMERDMWRREHGELVGEEIAELSPSTRVIIPTCGQVIEL